MKIVKIALCALAAALALTIVLFVVSPTPTALLLRKLFEKPSLAPPDGYAAMERAVTANLDLTYPSAHGDNTLDLYLPNDADEPLPVIIWVHGGAYVGGDKSDARLYATALASEGYAVISMNYERAPEAKYPTPITQLGEVCAWVRTNAEAYTLDPERLILAGDSAGAHTAATFALIQTNPAYAEEIGIAPSVALQSIRGTILCCGPYDVQSMGEIKSVFGFFLARAGWAYFGSRAWVDEYAIVSVAAHVTADFPPTFLTDGNTNSFEPQGRELVAALDALGVPVTSLFIDLADEITQHEYQFQMNPPAGEQCYEMILEFLDATARHA